MMLEIGRTVRWRGTRWRVVAAADDTVRLRGIEPAFRDVEVTPLVLTDGPSIEPDSVPIHKIDIARSDRPRWRAFHLAHQITMAGSPIG